MSNYVKNNLSINESIVYETSLHWINFFWSIIGLLLFTALPMLFFPAVLFAIPCAISYFTSAFAVTDKRVMIKVGWLSRKTFELNVNKVETVLIDQSFIGRILGYGTLIIVGTGGTREKFNKISNAMEFRRKIMELQVGE